METHRKRSPRTVIKTRAAGPFGAQLDVEVPARSIFPPLTDTVRCGELEIDRSEHRAMIGARDVPLTRREYTLLAFLAERQGRAVKREDLLAQIWTLEVDYGSNVLDVYVARLRQKLGLYSGMIQTIRGFGYRLRSPLAA